MTGVPSYLKVDIEGNDRYCVADLKPDDLPSYVSLEISEVEMLFALRDLGYTGFKLISQEDHSPLVVDLFSVKALLKRRLRPHTTLRRLAGWASRARGQVAAASAAPTNGSTWRFVEGSSGPFGEDTPGDWKSFDEAVYTWVTYRLGALSLMASPFSGTTCTPLGWSARQSCRYERSSAHARPSYTSANEALMRRQPNSSALIRAHRPIGEGMLLMAAQEANRV